VFVLFGTFGFALGLPSWVEVATRATWFATLSCVL